MNQATRQESPCEKRRREKRRREKRETNLVTKIGWTPAKKPLPVVGDFHCPDCLLTIKNRRKSYSHKRCPGKPRPEDRALGRYQQERSNICAACDQRVFDQERGEWICGRLKEILPEKPCVIPVGVKIPESWCPLEKWKKVLVTCERCGADNFDPDGVWACGYCGHQDQLAAVGLLPNIQRTTLPGDMSIITFTDVGFLRGAYFLAWTLFHHHQVRFRVYCTPDVLHQPMAKRMLAWGVEFAEIDMEKLLIPRSVQAWQTWNKPLYITKEMERASRVLWIDSDCSIGGHLEDIIPLIDAGPVIPDHQPLPINIPNPPNVHRVLGKPTRRWPTGGSPCAGVMGLASPRDYNLLTKWITHINLAERHKLLDSLKYYDQSVIQDIFDHEPVDGTRWNFLKVRRVGSIRVILQDNYGRGVFDGNVGTINHYGGPVKPFLKWPEDLDWGDPREHCDSL